MLWGRAMSTRVLLLLHGTCHAAAAGPRWLSWPWWRRLREQNRSTSPRSLPLVLLQGRSYCGVRPPLPPSRRAVWDSCGSADTLAACMELAQKVWGGCRVSPFPEQEGLRCGLLCSSTAERYRGLKTRAQKPSPSLKGRVLAGLFLT